MADPLSDPLPEVVAEFGENSRTSAPPPAPSPPVIPHATVSPEPRPAPLRAPSTSDIADLRDGLAGMRTDLRQVPEQVGQAISGTVLHAVSVALTEVRRPLEGMTLITEQLAAVLGRLEGVAGLKDQVGSLQGLPDAVARSAGDAARDLGAITSDINALLSRVTSIDGRVSTTTSGLETTRLTLADVERRLIGLDDTLAEVGRKSLQGSETLIAAIRDEVAHTVRDQLRDLVRDGVRDGLDDQLAHLVGAGIESAIGPAVEAAVASALATALESVYDEMLAYAIEQAQEALERRLVLHIDDAVMQLAEVIMRHQVQTLKSVTVVAPAEDPPATKTLTDEEHTELDRLLTRITPPASLADAVANAVARAGIGAQFARALQSPVPPVPQIPVVAADTPNRPRIRVPRSTPDAAELTDILQQWRDPELRTAALAEAKGAATAAVEAAESERTPSEPTGSSEPAGAKRKGIFGRKKG